MLEVTINIDPFNAADLTKVLEFILNQPCMSTKREEYKNSSYQNFLNQRNFDGNRVSNNKIAELEKDIEMHQNENAKNQDIIQKNKADIPNLEKEKSEIDKKHQRQEEEFNQRIKSFKDTCNRELLQKDNEIKELKKLLGSYSVSYGSDDPNDKNFFEVSKDNTLEESMISADSLYCANKSGDIYKFTINNDGPIKIAISNIEQYIIPFCTIQENIEGANTINIVSIGKAKLTGNTLQIIDKAVVSLIKQ